MKKKKKKKKKKIKYQKLVLIIRSLNSKKKI